MTTPNISVHLEPTKASGTVSYLRCAPTAAGATEWGYLNLYATIKNEGGTPLTLKQIEVSVPNSETVPRPWNISQSIAPGNTAEWVQPNDYLFRVPSGPLALLVKIWAVAPTDPKIVAASLIAHINPTPQKNYRFWGAVRDLRPGEFWQVEGTRHSQTKSQMFGYDIGVSVESGNDHNLLLPDTDGLSNEHHRIWGKPVYAVADGKVGRFRNDYPTNRPLGPGETYQSVYPAEFKWQDDNDGNGNFFTITTGDETVVYAHMQPGSLNPKFLTPGAAVKAGDFLGRAGNSGRSPKPHLHIHSNKTIPRLLNTPGPDPWDTIARPMVMRGARVVAWTAVKSNPAAAPWALLVDRGFPPADCAVWPSESPVVRLRYVTAWHMAISEKGQLWVVRTDDNEIRTTNDLVSPDTGIYMDVVPGGRAKEIALVQEKPYHIGMNDTLFEGRPDGWVPVPGSPSLKRISANPSNGVIWCITPNNSIVSYSPSSNLWTPDPAGGKAKDICAWEGGVFIIGLNDHIYKSGPGGWAPLPGEGTAKRIAVDPGSGKLWVIGMNDGIWSYNGNGGWNEHPHEGRGKDIVVHKGKPYVIGTDFNVWKSVGAAGWAQINVVESQ